jgi:hypothetical protein
MAPEVGSSLLQAGKAAVAAVSPAAPTAPAPAPVLDAEKPVCYQAALDLQVLCGTLVHALPPAGAVCPGPSHPPRKG